MSLSHPKLIGLENAKPYEMDDCLHLYNVQPPKMLIDNFLPAASVMGITASPGVGKTWLTFELMRSCSQGTPFLGKFDTNRPMSCLFVGSDASVFDYARQWRRLTVDDWGEYTDDDINPIENNCRFLIQSGFLFEDLQSIHRLLATSNNFDWGYEHDVLKYDSELDTHVPVTTRSTGFKVIIFDTLSKMTRANQNDNTEMEEVFRNIRLVSEYTGASVIILHHNAKRTEFNGGEDWRGAVAQIGALDCWLQLAPSNMDRRIINAEMKKFRGITPEPFSYRMNVDDENTASLVYCEPPASKSFDDTLRDDIIKWVVSKSPVAVNINNIVDGMWADWANNYSQDKVKFREVVRLKLRNITRTRGSRIVKLEKQNKRSQDLYAAPSLVLPRGEGGTGDVNDLSDAS